MTWDDDIVLVQATPVKSGSKKKQQKRISLNTKNPFFKDMDSKDLVASMTERLAS